METGLNTAKGDGGGGGDDDVGGSRAHGADVKSNAQYLARKTSLLAKVTNTKEGLPSP